MQSLSPLRFAIATFTIPLLYVIQGLLGVSLNWISIVLLQTFIICVEILQQITIFIFRVTNILVGNVKNINVCFGLSHVLELILW